MECKYHSGQEADLVCLKCAKPYCRDCVEETGEAHYCIDCHRETVERFASQMGVSKKARAPKIPKGDKKPRGPEKAPVRHGLPDVGPTLESPSPSSSTLSSGEKAAFWSEEEKRVTSPAARGSHRERKREGRLASGGVPVAMQVPEEYCGEVTGVPSYFKAVLIAMVAGLASAAAYAGLEWWLHKNLGILLWILGFGVGIAVMLGSGRHYNWKLGLIAAGTAMLWVSVGRVAYYMLDIRFNRLFPFKMSIWPLFRESASTYVQDFSSIWLVFFLIAATVAFLVSFRPPPIKLR
ncbi:MAG: hypothetical protein CVT63_07470 [Candidatus Anoxymicrobium japonicum]|uniref:B box-type domain-containing protein n=1 Tax=Candidatus Anoxymicrobium japonicum TaxID=2013648 RepID=A0A2N3G475_9ACTN|nr:MAG: hypothetical protein CVT63_07470 [Candidatus Anoxymicrobium japonicum]